MIRDLEILFEKEVMVEQSLRNLRYRAVVAGEGEASPLAMGGMQSAPHVLVFGPAGAG